MLKNVFSVKNITLAHYMEDKPGTIYKNYYQTRGVCGIVTVLKGCSEYSFADGRKRMLKAGEIAVFSDKTAYTVKNVSNEPFSHYTINFNLSADSELPAKEAYLKTDNITKFKLLCDEILKCRSSPLLYSDVRSMAFLYTILAEIFENPSTELTNSSEYCTVAPAIRMIETEYASDINIESLSNLCMMSKTNFRRVFKRVCGVSPIEYLINSRIERAETLLIHTKLSVFEIAVKCGFKSSEHFCRTFKKRRGKTAYCFRNNYRGYPSG